jgi:hypothetical protein
MSNMLRGDCKDERQRVIGCRSVFQVNGVAPSDLTDQPKWHLLLALPGGHFFCGKLANLHTKLGALDPQQVQQLVIPTVRQGAYFRLYGFMLLLQ